MDARLLIGCVGIVGAYVCACTTVHGALLALERAQRLSSSGQDAAARLLRNGFRPLLGVADVLLRWRKIEQFSSAAVALAFEKGLMASGRSIVSLALAGFVLLGAVVAAVSQSVVVGALGCVAGVVVSCMALSAHHERRRAKAYESLPDALASMAACQGAGFTLLQTFRQVSKDVKGPLSQPFAQAAHTLELGGSASDALAEIKRGSYSHELAFMAVALDVQHQSGGSMKQVLSAVSDTVRGELAVKRSLRVQTAQAKLSARVVSVMPLVLVVLFSIVSPGYLDPFFQSVPGIALFGLAVVMQVAGVLLARRALAVGGAA